MAKQILVLSRELLKASLYASDMLKYDNATHCIVNNALVSATVPRHTRTSVH